MTDWLQGAEATWLALTLWALSAIGGLIDYWPDSHASWGWFVPFAAAMVILGAVLIRDRQT